MNEIPWNERLIGILGARGTGKTTLLLQHLKKSGALTGESLYVTADDLFFSNNSLYETIELFRSKGGTNIYIDEIHTYSQWSRELKNIYDTYPDIRIIFSGSSVVDILRQQTDLSRRALVYNLPGLSFREYLSFDQGLNFDSLELDEMLEHHVEMSFDLTEKFKPLAFLPEFFSKGYYPFYKESPETYFTRIEQIIHHVTERDLAFFDGFDPQNARKIQQLLMIISESVPFKPNVSKLSERIGINRNTLVQYLHHLHKGKMTNHLTSDSKGISKLQKPDKIYLENTTLMRALSPNRTDIGNMRETFALSMLMNSGYIVNLSKNGGDFLVQRPHGRVTFVVGGKDKSNAQIKGIEHSYIVSDDIENGVGNRIPLWLLGFLY